MFYCNELLTSDGLRAWNLSDIIAFCSVVLEKNRKMFWKVLEWPGYQISNLCGNHVCNNACPTL